MALVSANISIWASSMILRLESTEWTFIAACEYTSNVGLYVLQYIADTCDIIGHGQASAWQREGDARARLVLATVSTRLKRLNGSRIDSKVLLGEIVHRNARRVHMEGIYRMSRHF